MTTNGPSANWTRRIGGLAAIGCVAGTVVAAFGAPTPDWAWVGCLAALTLFCVAVGVATNGRTAGLFIDERNRVSLARLQAAAWSVLVLSALLTAVVTRIRVGNTDPAGIDVPVELLAVMGISAASLVAAPMVLSLKSSAPSAPVDGAIAAARIGDDPGEVAPAGKLYARREPAQAQWLDIFRGEEVADAATPDLSKVQQFMVTAVVLIAYGAALWSDFAATPLNGGAVDPRYLQALPDFSPNMLWLIGLSHAGYLAYKATPHVASSGPSGPSAAGAVG